MLRVTYTCNAAVSCSCDQQTSTTTNVIDDATYSSTSAPSWTRTTVADGHKFSAAKASEPETSQPIEKRTFYLPTCIWSPRWSVFLCWLIVSIAPAYLEEVRVILQKCHAASRFPDAISSVEISPACVDGRAARNANSISPFCEAPATPCCCQRASWHRS